MKVIFDTHEQMEDIIDYITKHAICPYEFGLENSCIDIDCNECWKMNCDLSCVDCWSNALAGISEIKQDVPLPDREEQHNNDLIFAKRILKARIMCGERETQAKCTGDCDGCRLLYESGSYAEMIHAYQIAIQCIEREERLRKWLQAETEKATTSA